MDFSAAIETLYRLNTGVIGTGTGRHERPHKPVMLLAVAGQPLLAPVEPAFAPHRAGLEWRFERLLN